jgi:probable F420-dependent oxidoreductase
MKIGFSVPTRGPLATPENLERIVEKAEELGFDIVSVSDHVVIPRAIDSRYPYSASGQWAGDPSGACLEQLTLLTYIAARTTRLRLLSSVMVLPQRPAVLTAKMLASLDALSNGRLIFGVGAGWMREEFEALGAPPFDERGKVTDEYLRAFKELWTSDQPSFQGEYTTFGNIAFAPKPVQQPHPPIWVGGESPAALRRVARVGDAWYPIGSNPRHPMENAGQLSQAIDRLRRYTEEAGRDPSTIELAYSAGWYNDREPLRSPDSERRTFTGTPEQVAADINEFEALGVRHLIIGLQDGTVEGMQARMERFATEVRPKSES